MNETCWEEVIAALLALVLGGNGGCALLKPGTDPADPVAAEAELRAFAARYFDQASVYGAVLDMVTDRLSTAGLLTLLAALRPASPFSPPAAPSLASAASAASSTPHARA